MQTNVCEKCSFGSDVSQRSLPRSHSTPQMLFKVISIYVFWHKCIIPVRHWEVRRFSVCNPRHPNVNLNIQHQRVTLGRQKKTTLTLQWRLNPSFLWWYDQSARHKKTLVVVHTAAQLFAQFFLSLSFFLFSSVSKKSRSSFRRPARPQSETWTGWLRELWGRGRRSPSRPGSCDRLQQSHAWQSSQTWGRGRRGRDPLRLRSSRRRTQERSRGTKLLHLP